MYNTITKNDLWLWSIDQSQLIPIKKVERFKIFKYCHEENFKVICIIQNGNVDMFEGTEEECREYIKHIFSYASK